MKKRNRIISMVLAMAVMLSLFTVSAQATGFKDIQGLSCEQAVNYLSEKSVVNGKAEGVYAPNDGLTRAEMVTIILRAYGYDEVEDIEKFEDVPPTHWAYMYVETAYKMGIVNGMTYTTFEPDGQVTYEQTVKMLVCAMKKEGDAIKAGAWPDGYITVANDLGVLNGIGTQKGQVMNRGDMAQLVYNCLNTDLTPDYEIDWEGVEDHYDWIKEEKIRCIYGHNPITEEDENGVLKRLENAGVNTVFLNLNDTSEFNSNTMDGWIKTLDKAVKLLDEKYDFHDFIKINFGDNGVVKNVAHGQFHPGIYRESYFSSPCPLSMEYWDNQILARTKLIAQKPTVEGIILDFEMYSGGISQFTSPCMCDRCWGYYIEDNGYGDEWKAVEATERSAYVTNAGQTENYKNWFAGRITEILTYIREETHKINPKIIFGYFPAFEWLPGMTKGLGTPERPVIVASENEYWGSLANVQNTMTQIKEDENLHAIYLPGLYPDTKNALNPETLEEKIKLAAPTTAGYWMFAAHTLRNDEGHYDAVANANAALDEMIRTGDFAALPEYEVRSYSASKISGEIPTDEEWEAAPYTEDFVDYKEGEAGTISVESRAKILYSDNDFFVRVYAYDDMNTVNVGNKQPHDENPWAGDCVEFFWRFDGANDAAQLVSDLAGSTWDAYCTGVASKNSNVNFEGFSAEAQMFDDHWEMTLRVPGTLDGVKKIETGDVLCMEIGRYHPASAAKGEQRNHCWAPTYGSYLGSPSIWGQVTLD